MHIGFSNLRLGFDRMPMHGEVRDFTAQLAEKTGYKIVNEAPESRVVLFEQAGEANSSRSQLATCTLVAEGITSIDLSL